MKRAVSLVEAGQCRRAVQALEAQPLAPSSEPTRLALQELHPDEVGVFDDHVDGIRVAAKRAAASFEVDIETFYSLVVSAPRRAAADRFGWTSEGLRVCAGDASLMEVVRDVVQCLCRGQFRYLYALQCQ